MNIPDVTSATNSATGQKTVDQIGKSTSTPTILNPVMPSQMTQPRLNLIPDSDADDIVEVNNSCVFKYEFESDINNEEREKLNPKGNLRKHIAFWKAIGASHFILNVIAEVYRLPSISIPKPAIFANNNSTHKHREFVTEAIAELLSSGRIIQTPSKPRVVNPLSDSV